MPLESGHLLLLSILQFFQAWRDKLELCFNSRMLNGQSPKNQDYRLIKQSSVFSMTVSNIAHVMYLYIYI